MSGFYDNEKLQNDAKLYKKLSKLYTDMEHVDYCLGGLVVGVMQPSLLLTANSLIFIDPRKQKYKQVINIFPLECLSNIVTYGIGLCGIRVIINNSEEIEFALQVPKKDVEAMVEKINEYIKALESEKNTETIDYNNMSQEQLEQLKKERLVSELKQMDNTINYQNDNEPIQSNNKHIHKPSLKRSFCCPKCKSTNITIIDNAVGGTKTKVSLNPLHPFTITKTEKKKKKVRSTPKTVAAMATGGLSALVTGGTKKKVSEEWYCRDCGKRWYK